MALFKGELKYDDIMNMQYKQLFELREVRVKRLVDEAERIKKENAEMERANARQAILAPP